MRILHSVHDYFPDQVAGVEVYTSRLVAAQRRRDDVAILTARRDTTRRSGSLSSTSDGQGPLFEVVQNHDALRFERSYREPRFEPAFDAVLDEFEPDLVHVQHLLNLGVNWVDVVKRRGIPVVMTLHDHWFACARGGQRFHPDRTSCDRLDAQRCARCTWAMTGPVGAGRIAAQRLSPSTSARSTADPSGTGGRAGDPAAGDASPASTDGGFEASARSVLRRLLPVLPTPFGVDRIEQRWRVMRALGEKIDRFIVPSRDLANASVEFGIPVDRIDIVPHGLPRDLGGESRTYPPCARRFGYLGSIVPHKGVHHLIAAFDRLPADAQLSIIGSLDDDREYIRELRSRARHPGIHFEGEIAPDAVPDRLRQLDCLIAPSIWRENAPLSIQEALMAGTPVVASAIGGQVELLEKGGGILVPPGHEGRLSEALLRLSNEPGLLVRLVASAPPVRSIEEHARDVQSVYESLPSYAR